MEVNQMNEPVRTTLAPATRRHPRNDSATIVELTDGRLFVMWMEFLESDLQGADEAPNHIASAVSTDGGRTWEGKRVAVEAGPGDISVYNPSLLRLSDGSILLHYFAYNALEWGKPLVSTGYAAVSTDECETWSRPVVDWERRPYHHANDTYVQLKDGRIIHPFGKVPIWGGSEDNQIASARFSDDNGATWQESANDVRLPLRGAMEPHIAQVQDDHLVMVVRTQLGGPFASHSYDSGKTWSKPQTMGLTGCESMPAIVRIPATSDLLLIWNNSYYDPDFDHFGKRTPLRAAVLSDEGTGRWCIRTIASDPAVEYTNPSCTMLSNGRVIITYLSSPMENPHPPGKLGRSAMSLECFVASVDWFYGRETSSDREVSRRSE